MSSTELYVSVTKVSFKAGICLADTRHFFYDLELLATYLVKIFVLLQTLWKPYALYFWSKKHIFQATLKLELKTICYK